MTGMNWQRQRDGKRKVLGISFWVLAKEPFGRSVFKKAVR